MTLKDTIKEDIDNIFFNIDEFAETHELDGNEILMVVDANDSQDYQLKTLELKENVFTIYFKTKDYKIRKKYGHYIRFDGKECSIENSIENYGVTCLTLKQNKK